VGGMNMQNKSNQAEVIAMGVGASNLLKDIEKRTRFFKLNKVTIGSKLC
jgi:hypothetical protein